MKYLYTVSRIFKISRRVDRFEIIKETDKSYTILDGGEKINIRKSTMSYGSLKFCIETEEILKLYNSYILNSKFCSKIEIISQSKDESLMQKFLEFCDVNNIS